MHKTTRWHTASLAAFLMFVYTPVALAHAHLITSRPAAGSKLDSSPPDLVLNFTEPLEPAFIRVELTSGGKPIPYTAIPELGATHKSFTLHLPVVGPGHYDVIWHVVSTDGHRTEGRFAFQVGTP